MSLKRFFIQIVTVLVLVSSNQLFPVSQEKNGITVDVTDYVRADFLDKQLFSNQKNLNSGFFVLRGFFPLKLVVTNNTPNSISLSPESISLDLQKIETIPHWEENPKLGDPKITIPYIFSILSGGCVPLWLVNRETYLNNKYYRDQGYHLVAANFGGKCWVKDNYNPNNYWAPSYKEENAFTTFFGKWGGWLAAGLGAIGVAIACYGVRQIKKLYQQEMLHKRVILQPGESIEKIIFINGDAYNKDEFTIKIHSLNGSNQETEFTIDWRF